MIDEQSRDWTRLEPGDSFRFEDRKVIEKLLQSKKLTDRQREALRRLLADFDYMCD